MRLPAELIERVIDHLHDDCVTLAAFCLVSRGFVASSRFHLWYSLDFTPSVVYKGVFCRDPFTTNNSPVLKTVKYLKITSDGRDQQLLAVRNSIPVLECLTSVQTLHFALISLAVPILPSASPSRILLRHSNTVTRLILEDVYFGTGAQFSELVSGLTKLRSFAMHGKGWVGLGSDSITFPSKLEEFELDTTPKIPILRALIAGTHLNSITCLSLGKVIHTEIEDLNVVLRATALSLEKLFINYIPNPDSERFSNGHRTFDLSLNSRLRTATFHEAGFLLKGEVMPQWICDLILQITSSRLEKVSVRLQERTISRIRLHGLVRAVPWLAKSRFPHLHTVLFEVHSNYLVRSLREEFKDWDKAGILVVKHIRAGRKHVGA